MTINHRMKAPPEMATERIAGEPMSDTARARMRMSRICATPEEVELYRYSPNAARNNLRPGIPLPDYNDTYED